MTVKSTTTPRKNYNGDDVTVSFPITFEFNSSDDITVVNINDATADQTTWTLDGAGATGYTISGSTLTANTAPATGTRLVLIRDTTQTQGVDLQNNVATRAEVTEGALDRAVLMIQELNRILGDSVRLDTTVTDSPTMTISELAADRAGKFIVFNAAGTAIGLASQLTGDVLLLNENDMASNDATNGSTQRAIANYVKDATITLTNKTLVNPQISNFIGMMAPWTGTIANIPTGWLICDGSSLLRATYANLFAAIGTLHGSADGTHFNIPAMDDSYLLHADADSGGTNNPAVTGGSATHSHADTLAAPAHTHTVPFGGWSASVGSGAAGVLTTAVADRATANRTTTGASVTALTGSVTSETTRPTFLAIPWVIHY